MTKGEADDATIGKWSLRLGFRIAKAIASDDEKITREVAGRTLTLRPHIGAKLSEANGMVATVHGFETEEDASSYSAALRIGMLISAIERQNGLDLGSNDAAPHFSKIIHDMIAEKGCKILPSIHGEIIYKREGNEIALNFSAEGKVMESVDIYFQYLENALQESLKPSERQLAALELVSMAGMAREPMSAAALNISAVEMLASAEPWSPAQLALLSKLQQQANNEEGLPTGEAHEVSEAVKRSFKSIRQSIKRLILNELFLEKVIWRRFDKVYGLRSAVFHGSAAFDRKLHMSLSVEAGELCRQIVLSAARSNLFISDTGP